jgi:hypothetical protein
MFATSTKCKGKSSNPKTQKERGTKKKQEREMNMRQERK